MERELKEPCNCLNKIRQNIVNNTPNVIYAKLELSNIVNVFGDQEKKKTGQALEIGYKYKKKDGRETTKHKKTYIIHDYCPFCGQKYD